MPEPYRDLYWLARRTRRRALCKPLVTDGPFAETVEPLSGFYLVSGEAYDALVQAAKILLRAHPVVKNRPVEEF